MSTELASLYNIEGAIVGLMELRAEAEAEGDAAQLAVLDKEIDAWIAQEIRKVDHIANYIRECERRAEVEAEEAGRHRDRAAMWAARADRVRASSLAAMKAHDVKVVNTPANTIRRQKNGGADPVQLSQEFACEHADPNLSDAALTIPWLLWMFIADAAEQIVPQLVIEVEKHLALSPNLGRIREALKRGDKVPGAQLRERGEHLRLE